MTAAERIEDRAKRTTLWYDLVLDDAHATPDYLRERLPYEPRSRQIPVARYTSREYHLLEREHLWRKVWQMACREENLPEVGSYIVYDSAGDSYIVVRTREGIKAYVNACLHRGRALKDYDGRCSEFRCPFHGFTWRLDGTLRFSPAPAEFPEIDEDRDNWRLPEAAVGLWGGFVFINPDPNCGPLTEFLGSLPEHFARWDMEHRYLQAHVAKKLRCNWKVAQEAFDEGLHLGATHPQSAPYVGDVNTAVDMYGNYARQLSPSGTPVEDMPLDATEVDILKRMLDVREGEDLPVPFSQRSTARGAMADASRERWRQVLGDEIDEVSDAELVDHWNYAIFPNFHPWGGYNRIVYRFRPNGDRHDECVFEVMLLTPYRGEKPPTAAITYLDFDEPWSNAPELQTLGLVMEQDSFNMESVQRGLESLRRPYVTVSNFQEGIIAWRHDLLTSWVDEAAKATP
jgi:phenylpropionate dioxygenase-like ring-hydroxylating dioxygenase large terminal subunit